MAAVPVLPTEESSRGGDGNHVIISRWRCSGNADGDQITCRGGLKQVVGCVPVDTANNAATTSVSGNVVTVTGCTAQAEYILVTHHTGNAADLT